MSSPPSDALTANQLLEMYYFARLAREVEERLVILFRQSKVVGGLYRSLGQEGESVAAAIAMGSRMRRSDAEPRVAMAWIGDGATSTGAFHEGKNFAAVQKSPFV